MGSGKLGEMVKQLQTQEEFLTKAFKLVKDYKKFGFDREDGRFVYGEWAHAAQEAELIGNFNGWDSSNNKMEKDQFEVWSIKIQDSDGKPAIPHNSMVKFW